MLTDSINKSFAAADRMVSLARTKAAVVQAGLPGALSGGESEYGRSSLQGAADQYAHNRGWVGACVKLIAQRIAGQTVCVARESLAPAGNRMMTKSMRDAMPMRLKRHSDQLEPLDSHPLLDTLNDPGDLFTCWSLLFVTVSSLELTGRALWYVTEDDAGGRTIFPIPVSWVVEVDKKRTTWTVRLPGSGAKLPLPGDQVVHFFYPDPADPWGALSPLSQIADAVAADEAIGETHWRTFRQGQHPGLILSAGRLIGQDGREGARPVLTAEQRKQLINAIRQAYSGVAKFGEPLILDGLIEKVEKLTFTPKELDFMNSVKITKEKVLQNYHVSEILLGATQNANRASATVADEIFLASKVNPLIELMSQAMTEWLGPLFARPGEKLIVWIEKAVAHDPEMDQKKWEYAASNGFVDENEFRKHVLNLPERKADTKPAAADPSLPPAMSAAPAQSDVQATALNGAQIDSLLKIAELVSAGTLTREAARALIAAAFPLLPQDRINSIVDSIEVGTSTVANEIAKQLNPFTMRPLNTTKTAT